MSPEKQDERRWPTPLNPVAGEKADIYEDIALMDPAIRKNDKVEFLLKVAGDGGAGRREKATFGAGCFWHVEHSFSHVPGVVSTQVGFMGGTKENPSYEEVCTGLTGHTEVVEVTFDPDKLSYDQLLDAFWKCHDPTQVNRQGPDVGVQYRSVIFYHGEAQQKTAAASRERAQKALKKPIATKIEPAKTFYRAEEYHQKYFEKTGKSACGI